MSLLMIRPEGADGRQTIEKIKEDNLINKTCKIKDDNIACHETSS
jgi:hypothetical protein